MKGDLKLSTIDGDRRKLAIVLTDVLYVPRLKRRNLCSLSKITGTTGIRVNLTAEDSVIVQKEGEISIKLFSSREESRNFYNMVLCTRMEVEEHALFLEKVGINILNGRLGHPSEFCTRKTAEKYNVPVKKGMKVCEACTYGKGKQKPVKKFIQTRTSEHST